MASCRRSERQAARDARPYGGEMLAIGSPEWCLTRPARKGIKTVLTTWKQSTKAVARTRIRSKSAVRRLLPNRGALQRLEAAGHVRRMRMSDEPIPANVRDFILRHIDTIAQLEALSGPTSQRPAFRFAHASINGSSRAPSCPCRKLTFGHIGDAARPKPARPTFGRWHGQRAGSVHPFPVIGACGPRCSSSDKP